MQRPRLLLQVGDACRDLPRETLLLIITETGALILLHRASDRSCNVRRESKCVPERIASLRHRQAVRQLLVDIVVKLLVHRLVLLLLLALRTLTLRTLTLLARHLRAAPFEQVRVLRCRLFHELCEPLQLLRTNTGCEVDRLLFVRAVANADVVEAPTYDNPAPISVSPMSSR